MTNIKKRLIVGIVVLLAAAGGIAWTVSWRSVTTQRELEAAYARLSTALRARDSAAFMEMLSPDYVEMRLNKTVMDRKRAEAHYRQSMTDWTSIRRHTADIFEVKVEGSRAHVTVHKVTDGVMTDRLGVYGPKGRAHEMLTDTMDVDVWVKSDRGWQLRQRHIALASLKVDGKSLHTHDPASHSESGHDHAHSH